uniref:G-protein coupled receptors family 1 profile domain-containing protein n=1 Tax=Petromyzon marinus TaxID=7757 RepID=S4R7L6_PETMA
FSPMSQLVILVAGCPSIAWAIAGNLLVIPSIALFSQLQTWTNFLALSLAVFDLVAVMTMPYKVAVTVYNCWFHGQMFSKIHFLLSIVFCNASVITIKWVTKRTLAVMVLLMCVGTLLLSTPVFVAFIMFVTKRIFERARCTSVCMAGAAMEFDVFLGPLPFVVSLLTATVLYSRVYVVTRSGGYPGRDRPPPRSEKKRRSSSSSRAASRTLAIIVGFFTLSRVPMVSFALANVAMNFAVAREVWSLMCLIGFVNAMLNPLIHVTSDRRFGVAFHAKLMGKMLRWVRARNMNLRE